MIKTTWDLTHQRYQYDGPRFVRYIRLEGLGTTNISVNVYDRDKVNNGTPMDEYHNRVKSYNATGITRRRLERFIKDNAELILAISSGYSERWNGNNYVGSLDETAEDAYIALDAALEDLRYEARNR